MTSQENEPAFPGAEDAEAALRAVQAIPGYSLEVEAEVAAEWWAEANDHVVADFLQLYLENPQQAPDQIPEFLKRFGKINNTIDILTSVLPEQFGRLVNIASTNYGNLDRNGRKNVMNGIHAFLRTKSSTYTSHVNQLRHPILLRDMVYHWDAVNWPYTEAYRHFLEESTPQMLWLAMQDETNNPLLIALTVPLASTPETVRRAFRSSYPQLSAQALEVITAHLLCLGAHNEILDKTQRWEQSITDGLQEYAAEYRQPILEVITTHNFAILDEQFSFQSLAEKLNATRFRLDTTGKLLRYSPASAE